VSGPDGSSRRTGLESAGADHAFGAATNGPGEGTDAKDGRDGPGGAKDGSGAANDGRDGPGAPAKEGRACGIAACETWGAGAIDGGMETVGATGGAAAFGGASTIVSPSCLRGIDAGIGMGEACEACEACEGDDASGIPLMVPAGGGTDG
jgi:hypothetical protein